MLDRVGIIANTRARLGYSGLVPIMDEIHARGWHETRVFYCLPDSVSKLSHDLIELVMGREVQVLFVYGGDGTLHKVIDILIYEQDRNNITTIPPIVTLGGGTQKSLFQWLGWGKGFFFHEPPLKIFRRVMLSSLEHLPRRKMRPLSITFHNTRKGRVETHYGFIFIMGAMARVIQLYDVDGKSPLSGLKHIGLGMSGSLLGVPRSHASLVGQFQANQWADDVLLPRRDPLVVVCSVTDSLLFGIKPFRGLTESNQFYAGSYAIPASVLSALVPVEWRGTIVPLGDRFFNQPVFSFSVQPGEEGSFFVDGDFFFNTPGEKLTISLGPELELISHF